MVLKKHKATGKIYDPDTSLVYNSPSKERLVIGKVVGDEIVDLNSEIVAYCKENNINYDTSLFEEEEQEEEEEEEQQEEEEEEEEPAKQEPAKQEPAKQEPVKQEPAKQEPAKQEPAKQEPAKQEPVKQEPAKQEPAKQEPVKQVSPQNSEAFKSLIENLQRLFISSAEANTALEAELDRVRKQVQDLEEKNKKLKSAISNLNSLIGQQ